MTAADVSRRSVDLALTDLPYGGQPLGLVLADPAGHYLDQRRIRAELDFEHLELASIRLDGALTRLAGQVTLSRLCQCNARALGFLGLDLQERLGQLGLCVLPSPFGLGPTDLLAVDPGREAPGLALGALAGDLPQPLVNPRHWLFLRR